MNTTPRRIQRPLAAALPLLLLSLLPLGTATAQQPGQGSDGGQEARAPSKLTPQEQALLEAAREIGEKISVIRGLPLRRPIKKGVKDRDQLRQTLVAKLAEEVTDEDIENEALVYKRLGLIAPDLDYKKMFLDLLTEQIAGFYDQEAKELYIMKGIPLSLQRPAMAHELFHGVQDQHFDILSLQGPFTSKENSDFKLARSALIEGDATVLMIDFTLFESGQLPAGQARSIVDMPFVGNMLANLSFDDYGALESMVGGGDQNLDPELAERAEAFKQSALNQAPPIVRELLVFPYLGGMRFVAYARKNRAWTDVDAIYADAPVSTEQILHPERYFQRDDPTVLRFDPKAALPTGARPIYDTVFGELQTLLMLKTHLATEIEKPEDASTFTRQQLRDAAQGWDGDLMRAWRTPDDRTIVAHLSVWDSTRDAREYFDALGHMLRARYPDATLQTASGKHGRSLCALVAASKDGQPAQRLYLEQWGDMVLHLEGLPSTLDDQGRESDPIVQRMRQASFKTARRIPFAQELARKQAQLEADKSKKNQKKGTTQPAQPD